MSILDFELVTTSKKRSRGKNSINDGGLDIRIVSEDISDEELELTCAQELCWEAFECANAKDKIDLAIEALSYHSGCADAWNVLAYAWAKSPEDKFRLFKNGVSFGLKTLPGNDAQRRDYPYWLDERTRPYMRALEGVTLSLWDMGRHDAAIVQGQELLRLNPNDNQGIRYRLVFWLLKTENYEDAEALLERYDGDTSAPLAWARVLLSTIGDDASVYNLLKEAKSENSHVLKYVLGHAKFSKRIPDYIKIGSEEEAQPIAEDILMVLKSTKHLREKFKALLVKEDTGSLV